MTETITTVDKYKFVGPYRDNEALTNDTAQLLDNMNVKLPEGVSELEHTDEIKAELSEVKGSIVQYAADKLGIDVSSRVLDDDHIKLFDSRTFDLLLMKARGKKPGTSNGFEMFGNVHVRQGPRGLRTLSHELIHFASDNTRRITPTKDQGRFTVNRQRLGYNLLGEKFSVFNEGITEWMSRDIQRELWGQTEHLADSIETGDDAYPELVPRLQALVADAAGRLGEDPEDLKLDLFRGMLTGDKKGVRKLASVVGTETMRDIANMTDWYANTDLAKLAIKESTERN